MADHVTSNPTGPPPFAPPETVTPGVPSAAVYSANDSYQYNPRPDLAAAFSWAWAAAGRYTKQHVLSALVYFVLTIIGFLVYFGGLITWIATSEPGYDSLGNETVDFNPVPLFVAVGAMMVLSLLANITGPPLMLATAKMTADGEVPSVGAAWKRVRWGTMLGVFGLTIAGTLVGFLCFIIPGVLFAWLSPFMIVIVIEEGVSATEAAQRMVDLAKQNFWLMIVTGLLAGVIASLGSFLCLVGVLFSAPLSYLFLLFMYRGIVGKSVAWWHTAA